MRPGVSHLGGCVTARGPAQGPHLILRLILGASPGVCSELFREEPHSPLLSWDRERCRRSWKIEVIVTEPLLWQEHSCEDSFILVMNKRWEVSCSGIGTSTPDSADDCVDRWQLSASVFLAEQLVVRVLSELIAVTCASLVALHGKTPRFTELTSPFATTRP
ncbi:uncharacterized protein LOC129636178 isoform X17 [Bubalus kerabau]|uniref:uncharacterized protein LOC129636178 isoform X17 n=1 Tax=Bubalus carabanensis TaxID=3119969 RepID=UPI00244ECF51|nr:uncharacterized protein LOC129636178 isoform X17 [Bubalus carabanensis]